MAVNQKIKEYFQNTAEIERKDVSRERRAMEPENDNGYTDRETEKQQMKVKKERGRHYRDKTQSPGSVCKSAAAFHSFHSDYNRTARTNQ